jgi:hypothetical protein
MVIANPIQTNLIPHVISSYVRWSQRLWLIHRKGYTIWLTPNTCISNCFHQCVNMAWWAKGTKALLYWSILRALYRQKVLVALQRLYVTFILRCVIIVCEGSCRLIITLSSFLPFFFVSLIWFLWLVGALEHHLFLFPLGDSLLVLLF